MAHTILGLHHITAIAGDAQQNFDFYTKTLGLRLVKKTVNFDDPGTYHFYYGDETGQPGTILTFFPWQRVKQGRAGVGMATHIDYAVPVGGLEFWKDRLQGHKIKTEEINEKLGEQYLSLIDPDGLYINLVENATDARKGWSSEGIDDKYALKGFNSVTLTVRDAAPTAAILTDIFNYRLLKQEGNQYRFITDAVENAAIVDIVEDKEGSYGVGAGGTNHHIAFRVKDNEALMAFREKIVAAGFNITPQIDRNYFFSLYFREPGGILFELATDNPGFAVDEEASELGMNLKLPAQYEPMRTRIEKSLPVLKQ